MTQATFTRCDRLRYNSSLITHHSSSACPPAKNASCIPRSNTIRSFTCERNKKRPHATSPHSVLVPPDSSISISPIARLSAALARRWVFTTARCSLTTKPRSPSKDRRPLPSRPPFLRSHSASLPSCPSWKKRPFPIFAATLTASNSVKSGTTQGSQHLGPLPLATTVQRPFPIFAQPPPTYWRQQQNVNRAPVTT